MKRKMIAATAMVMALGLGLAGPAGATAYVFAQTVDSSGFVRSHWPNTAYHSISVSGVIDLPDAVLHPGDTYFDEITLSPGVSDERSPSLGRHGFISTWVSPGIVRPPGFSIDWIDAWLNPDYAGNPGGEPTRITDKMQFRVSYTGQPFKNDGIAISTLNFAMTAVPEPAAWATLLIGFAGLGAVLRRRRASAHRPAHGYGL